VQSTVLASVVRQLVSLGLLFLVVFELKLVGLVNDGQLLHLVAGENKIVAQVNFKGNRYEFGKVVKSLIWKRKTF